MPLLRMACKQVHTGMQHQLRRFSRGASGKQQERILTQLAAQMTCATAVRMQSHKGQTWRRTVATCASASCPLEGRDHNASHAAGHSSQAAGVGAARIARTSGSGVMVCQTNWDVQLGTSNWSCRCAACDVLASTCGAPHAIPPPQLDTMASPRRRRRPQLDVPS